MHQVLRGATVVDGTGAPGRPADVEVADGRIVAVGDVGRATDAREVDLDGLVLCPGFVDVHTHFDAQVFWDPDFTPSSWHGVTTVVQGNCGFGIAPMRPQDHEEIMQTLQRVEGMSLDTLREGIDWCFETFPEYLAALDRRPKRINLASYVGHTPVRMYVMGANEAPERAATADEVRQMKALVHEAIDAGAIGFSTSLAPSHVGARALPVPSRLADRDEIRELLSTVADTRRGVVEITYGPPYDIEEVARLSKDLGVRITWGSLLTGLFGPRGTAMSMLDQASAIGGDIWPQVSSRYITVMVHLHDTLLFFAPIPAFRDVLNATNEERERIYRDPAWRDVARAQVHSSDYEPAFHARTWDDVWIAETSKHRDLVGIRLSELGRQRGVDPFDLMLDLALEENLETRFITAVDNHDTVELTQLLRDPRTLLGAHDAGAHVDMLCDACYPSHVLGYWTREMGALGLEQAIWRMTGQPAEFFRIHDRGRVAPGLAADLVAFDPDRIAALPNERVWDFPADGDRLVSRNVGTYFVWVNGEPIRRDGEDVEGATPGVLVK